MKTSKRTIATKILGIQIANLNYDKTVSKILDWANDRENRYISVCNVHSVTSSLWTPKLRKALQASDLNTADGVPLVWLQKLLGHPPASRVYGPTLMLKTLEEMNRKGLSCAFYGGHPDRLVELEKFVHENYPKVKIVASISPPFRQLNLKEKLVYLDQLRAARPHVTWVGIGCPKQEIWMQENSLHLPGVLIGVGAAFDFHAGAVRQSPPALQRLGLEWAFRLYCEPRRLFKRYLTTNPIFLALALKQIIKKFFFGQNYLRPVTESQSDPFRKAVPYRGYAD